ncbi:MAG TPA: hypothetical protein VLE48_07765 [Terriglobales bacterium]|nr:hypothetical protein [Terriglobales bacterium]
MNGQTSGLEAAVRVTRTVHLTLLATIPLYFGLGEMLARVSSGDLRPVRQLLTVFAVVVFGALVVVRKRMLAPAMDLLRRNPDDTAALGRWRAANLISLALCESLALYGFVLRFLGASTFEAAPFFAVAFVLMLAFRPSAP